MEHIDKIVDFFTGFFKDANGKSSRKAIALYVCLFFIGDVVLKEKTPDLYVLCLLALVTLFCLGAITKEKVGEIMNNITKKKLGNADPK